LDHKSKFDVITLELIKNALASLADEMAFTIVRTGYSSVIKTNMDFATGFCDPEGQVLVQGLTIPNQLGAMPDGLAAILQRWRGQIYPGDAFILTDPYEGGMHLPDVFVVKPIFHEEELVGFAVTIAHHTDVGGRVPGSCACDSTEIYQEGLRIPPLKFYEQGEVNQTLIRLIEKNVRVPIKVLGDLRAQMSACHTGEREFLKLVKTYGLPRLKGYLEDLLDYTERLTRAEIATIPDGDYEFTDYIDDDGINPEPIPIHVKVTIDGDDLYADFAGSSPQVAGAINCSFPFTKSAVYLSVRSLIDRTIPNNGGFFRPMKVTAPEGTILNMTMPSACAARGLTGFRMVDAVLGALAQAIPNRVLAACEGGLTVISIGGYDEKRHPFVLVDMAAGAWGGRPDRDGIEGIACLAANVANLPAELAEVEQPITIDQYGFVPDTGGAGKFRGGLSVIRDYRLTAEHAILQVRSDRKKFLPYGLAGGKPGTPSCNILNPDGENIELASKVTMNIKRGDVFRHIVPGAGGWGDPFERDPQLVLEDILDEKITPGYAYGEYGVVIDEASMTINEAATNERRRSLREAATAAENVHL
jgi:N-methylhydantoinase B